MKTRMRPSSLAVLLVAAVGCSHSAALKKDADDLRLDLEQLRARRGDRYAPREMALAEANLDFFFQEYDEGDFWEAADDLAVVRENVRRARDLTQLREDRDQDGIPDVDDRCPDGPEVMNGYLDEDGCPDSAAVGSVSTDGEMTFQMLSQAVQFQSGSAVLLPSAKQALEQVARELAARPGTTLDVDGHTDSSGTVAGNRRLSQERADAVKAYLVSLGVAESRVRATGYGQEQPVASNATADGRARNRRVELLLR